MMTVKRDPLWCRDLRIDPLCLLHVVEGDWNRRPPEIKRFDGRLAVLIGKIFGEVPELQPVRMVTPNVTWDRPRVRTKLQYKVQCTIFISITINWRSLAVLDGSCKISSEQCVSPWMLWSFLGIPFGASFHTVEMLECWSGLCLLVSRRQKKERNDNDDDNYVWTKYE